MRKGSPRKGGPPSGNDGNNKPDANRGPGTLAKRLNRLRQKLKPPDMQRAEALAKSEQVRVLQAAYYLAREAKKAQKHERLIARYEKALAKLKRGNPIQ